MERFHSVFLLVRVTGLEPARRGHQNLNLARLPIPPYPQVRLVYPFCGYLSILMICSSRVGRLRSEGICADAARAHKRVDTCGFHPLVNLPFPLEGLAQIADMRPLRNRGTAEDFSYRRGAQCAPISLPIRSARQFTATQAVYSTQARHKVNCPKDKRGSHGDDSVAQRFCVLLRTAPAGLIIGSIYLVGCADLGAPPNEGKHHVKSSF